MPRIFNYEVPEETAYNLLFLFFVLVILPLSSGIIFWTTLPLLLV